VLYESGDVSQESSFSYLFFFEVMIVVLVNCEVITSLEEVAKKMIRKFL